MFQKNKSFQDPRRFIDFQVLLRVEILSRYVNMVVAGRVPKFSNGGEVDIQSLLQYRY